MRLLILILCFSLSTAVFAEGSGIFLRGGAGLSQSRSYVDGSSNLMSNQSNVAKFPSQSSYAANLGLGYQWSFGDPDRFSNAFIGLSADYYNFGRVVNPRASQTNQSQIISTRYSNLSAFGAGGFVGMHLASPLSLQLGVAYGGASQSQGAMGLFTVDLGYNITKHLKLYAQYLHAGIMHSDFSLFGVFIDQDKTGITVNAELVGLQYTF